MERISLEHEGKVALLRFNHPEVMNAIGGQMLRDFVEAIEEVKARGTETRCLMITGSVRAFCAGANLQDDDSGKKSKEAGASLRNSYHPLMFEIRDLGMPVVTAVTRVQRIARAQRVNTMWTSRVRRAQPAPLTMWQPTTLQHSARLAPPGISRTK